jgi:hypothetical protein
MLTFSMLTIKREKSMRTAFIIVACLVALLFISPACSKKSPQSSSQSPENRKDGAGAADTKDVNPAPLDPGGLNIPVGWPKDIPIMDGLTIQHAGPIENGFDAMMAGKIPVEKVEAFYSALPGWNRKADNPPESPGSTSNSQNGGKFFTMARGTETLIVSLGSQDSVTSVRLSYTKQ